MSKQQLIDKIRQFSELKPGWDSYGALAIDPTIIEAAVKLVEAVDVWGPPWPAVVPCSTGHLQFEWKNSDGLVLELELIASTTIRFFRGNEIGEKGKFSINDTRYAAELINWHFTALETP